MFQYRYSKLYNTMNLTHLTSSINSLSFPFFCIFTHTILSVLSQKLFLSTPCYYSHHTFGHIFQLLIIAPEIPRSSSCQHVDVLFIKGFWYYAEQARS